MRPAAEEVSRKASTPIGIVRVPARIRITVLALAALLAGITVSTHIAVHGAIRRCVHRAIAVSGRKPARHAQVLL